MISASGMRVAVRCLVVFFLAAAASLPARAVDAGHAHEITPGKLHLDHDKKWTTDEALRRGMGAIRAAMAERLEAIHQNKLAAADYRALGATVEREVARIVAECKLEPRADAMLHLVIADLMAGAEAMQGKSKTAPSAGARQVVQALNNYGKYFDHPGWMVLK